MRVWLGPGLGAIAIHGIALALLMGAGLPLSMHHTSSRWAGGSLPGESDGVAGPLSVLFNVPLQNSSLAASTPPRQDGETTPAPPIVESPSSPHGPLPQASQSTTGSSLSKASPVADAQEKSSRDQTGASTMVGQKGQGVGEGEGQGLGAGLGLDADGLPADERAARIAKIRKRIFNKQFYPPKARVAGVEGRVQLVLKVAKDGSIDHLRIQTSSGSEDLDAAATKAVQLAAPFPYVSPALLLPLVYSLH